MKFIKIISPMIIILALSVVFAFGVQHLSGDVTEPELDDSDITADFSGDTPIDTSVEDLSPIPPSDTSEDVSDESVETSTDASEPIGDSSELPDSSEEEKPSFVTAPEGYFNTSLFIGDSRTVGLDRYGRIKGAAFFADNGLNAFKIDDARLNIKGVGEVTCAELLEKKKFETVYVMFGINELGYDQNASVKKFGELVQMVRRLQPDATIFVQANLHVAKSLSDKSKIYNNKRIDVFNNAIKGLANNKDIFYLDVNEIFDDAEGNLDKQYTYDESHLLGKYYVTWVQWISEHTVVDR